ALSASAGGAGGGAGHRHGRLLVLRRRAERRAQPPRCQMTGAPLLDVRDLSVAISGRDGPVRVVDGISVAVGRGEALGVVGESGCGKSLTFLSLLGLLPNKIGVAGGSAMFGGRDLLKLRGEAL